MKKLLIALFATSFVFALSACGDEITTTELSDLIDAVELDTTALETSVATLQTELDALETELTALEGQSDDADVLIAQILLDIEALETDLAASAVDIAANSTDIAASEAAIVAIEASLVSVNALIVALDAQVAALEALVDGLVNPEFEILTARTTQIVIAHTNDVHGRVNEDSWAGSMGMSTVKNILDELDAKYDNTFFVDAGDILHGTTFATLEEGESMINVMNELGYDLMVPGNHDFNYGQDTLLTLEGLADFDMISANVEYDTGHASYVALADNSMFSPYVIQDFDGVSVAFFGLTSPETVYKTHPDNVQDLLFLDPVAQATAMVAELTPLADVIILLAHVGLDESTLVTTEDIALAVPGIDVIIDGHSHSVLDGGTMVNDTLIVSTGEYMKNLGVISINVHAGVVIGIDATLISAAEAEALDYGEDAAVQAYIDGITDAQDIILSEVVGQTSVLLLGERDDVRTGETNLGNIITDSMIAVTGADVAFTNGGGIRASIAIGDVTLGDIITVLPFGNIIHTKVVTGQVILEMLEHGTSEYPVSNGAFPHVAGMTFEINTDNAAGSRVENVYVDGVALDLVAEYTLATNDFLAAGGDGYDMLVGIPTAGEFMGLHEALESMFTIGTDIEIPELDRITVTPMPAPLFFSEYGEPSGGNCKYVEIYNPNSVAIDLDGYSTVRGSNGAFFNLGYAHSLFGTLEANSVLILGNSDCFYDSEDPDEAFDEALAFPFPQSGINLISDTSAGYTNGDDAIGLFYGVTLIDIIGVEGVDPGSSWPVGDGDLLGGFTTNMIMRRIPTVESGEVDWAVGAMQWIVVDHREYSDVGSHTFTPAS